jgi:hypothetical protein
MRFSIDTTIQRFSADGTANPKAPTGAVARDDAERLIQLLFLVEPMLGKAANWIDVVQIRFKQFEPRTGWAAIITFEFVVDAHSDNSSVLRFNTEFGIDQVDLNPERDAREFADSIACAIKRTFETERDRAETDTFDNLDNAADKIRVMVR